MMKFMPIRAMAAFNPERFSEDMLYALLNQLNELLENAPNVQTVGN
jgi:beta-glucosidase